MSSLDERLRRLVDMEPLKKNKKAAKAKAPKPPKNRVVVDFERLHECCDSELVSIAHIAGLEAVNRSMDREEIIFAILEGVENEDIHDVLVDVRRKIGAYVEGNKSIMASMMPCDLNCAACPHHQVVACFTTNRDLVEE